MKQQLHIASNLLGSISEIPGSYQVGKSFWTNADRKRNRRRVADSLCK